MQSPLYWPGTPTTYITSLILSINDFSKQGFSLIVMTLIMLSEAKQSFLVESLDSPWARLPPCTPASGKKPPWDRLLDTYTYELFILLSSPWYASFREPWSGAPLPEDPILSTTTIGAITSLYMVLKVVSTR